jgi:acetyl-CoA/propionyl-CoA carboxylase, biotin carboxylase, biotin carboxyl carrier protein
VRKVLIANRSEIAVRVIRACRDADLASVAVYAEQDIDGLHTRLADESYSLDGATPAETYLNIDKVIKVAAESGADAVHPGYGFLAENAAFARAVTAAGLVFIGPPASAIHVMGDKIRAKQAVAAAGVPVVPGRHETDLDDAALIAAAADIGFPVLLKPSAGGGGKGMRKVGAPEGLGAAIAAARREAAAAFGDDTLLIERYVSSPRHIEIQVLADAHGSVIHLGERECSLQRRHQKIIEEAPSPLLTTAQRDAMGAAAVQVAQACGYQGAGTVEFIVSGQRPADFYFLEMNTRLQVEHPVTELVTGLDLVEEQLRCAAGEPLRLTQPEVARHGHAMEARVCAEDPARGFLPTGGRVLLLREPHGEGIRVDSGIATGSVVTSDYDPMLAKVVAWGSDRATCLRRLDRALARLTILGVVTSTGFLRGLLADPRVQAGQLDTGLAEERNGTLGGEAVPAAAYAAAVLGRLAERDPGASAAGPFDLPGGWRLGGDPAWTRERLLVPGEAGPVEVSVRGPAASAQVRVGSGEPVAAAAELAGGTLRLRVGGQATAWAYARDGEVVWVGRDGHAWPMRPAGRARDAAGPAAQWGALAAPMPGTVTAVHVAEGDAVGAGQPLVAIEAMKMEHVVQAPAAGIVASVLVRVGQAVAMEADLVIIEPG